MTAVITFNVVPAVNLTFKYDRLGRMAIENRRLYCARHGYRFVSDVAIDESRPACWAKIPAMLDAFRTDGWVMWADSDTLVFELDRGIEGLCDPDYDMIVASHDEFFKLVGIPLETGMARMPINTGVFLMRACDWSADFLQRAYDQRQFVSSGEIWDGVGEQEAMIHVLHQRPDDLRRIKHVPGLQNHPRLYRRGDLFVHFYGNHARHRVAPDVCEDVLARWEDANRRGDRYPADLARFHWCCIQNKAPGGPVERGDLAHYLYRPGDLEGGGEAT